MDDALAGWLERRSVMGFEQLGKKLMNLGQDAKSGVQKVGETYQVNNKLNDEKRALTKLYAAIGKHIYHGNEQTPLEGLEDEFAAVKSTQENIRQLTEQLNRLKGIVVCPECGREASRNEKFCAGCGSKLPEAEMRLSDKMKQDMKDAAGEAGDIVDDMAGKAKDFFGNVADKADAFVKGMTSKRGSQTGDDVVDSTAREVEEPQEGQDTAETVKEAVEEFAGGVKEKAEDTFQTAKEKAEDAVENAKEAAAEFAGEVKEEAEDAFQTAKEKAEDAVENAKETAEEFAKEVKEKAEDAFDTAKEKAEDVFEAAKEKMADDGNDKDQEEKE